MGVEEKRPKACCTDAATDSSPRRCNLPLRWPGGESSRRHDRSPPGAGAGVKVQAWEQAETLATGGIFAGELRVRPPWREAPTDGRSARRPSQYIPPPAKHTITDVSPGSRA